MMQIETGSLLAFALTAVVIEITPGPNMAYLASLALTQGRRIGFAAVAGIALGLSAYGVAAALGLAAVIDSSRWIYETLRWSGVVYLLWLAREAWRGETVSPNAPTDKVDAPDAPGRAFRRGLITNLLNPKAAIFYIAVLPQFVSIGGGSLALQTLLLGAIYVAIATAIHTGIVGLAGGLQGIISTSERRRRVRRAMALALLAIAVWFAVSSGR